MSIRIANCFGVAADTIAALGLCAWVFAFTLPYRLSPMQASLFITAMWIELAGPLLAIGFGTVSLHGDARARRMGCLAIALAAPTLLLALVTVQPHSTSRW